ncbi:hypothetical protein AB3R30_17865 [Leptolyngbyaceae cyanobacterium UHCC 1019]
MAMITAPVKPIQTHVAQQNPRTAGASVPSVHGMIAHRCRDKRLTAIEFEMS